MRASHLYRSATVGLIAIGLAVAWHARLARRKAEYAAVALSQLQAATESQLQAAEMQRQAAERHLAEFRPAGPRPDPATPDPGAEQARKLRNDPQWQRRKIAATRAGLFLDYASFFHAQGLSASQVAKFEDIISDHRTRVMDLADAASAQGLNRSDPALAALQKEEKDQFAAEVSALLGPAGVQSLADYDGAGAEHLAMNRLAAVLATSPEPLSGDQYLQLVQLMATFKGPSAIDPANSVIDWAAVNARAAGLLSPMQMAEFRSEAAIPQRFEEIAELAARYKQWAQPGGTGN